jgi:TRAP-type C4-dicarboxylate transport system permease large subunit
METHTSMNNTYMAGFIAGLITGALIISIAWGIANLRSWAAHRHTLEPLPDAPKLSDQIKSATLAHRFDDPDSK